MNGQYKGPIGEDLSIQDRREIRLAAKTVLSKGVDLLPLRQLHKTLDRPQIMFTELRVPAPPIGISDDKPVLSEIEGSKN